MFRKEVAMKPNTFFRRKTVSLLLSTTILILSLSGCNQTTKQTFEEFTHDLFIEEITSNTINLHYTIENPSAYGITDYEISLGDFSKETRDSSKEELQKTMDELKKYEHANLTEEEQLTYDLLIDYIETQIALSDYDLYYEPLAFSGGLQMELPILYAEYKLNNEQDVQDYLELISLTDEYFVQVMVFEKEKSEAGLFMSTDLCEKVIESCEAFLEDTENHYLKTTFKNRLEKLDLSEQKVASYTMKKF